MNRLNILITGIKGNLGSQLNSVLNKKYNIIPFDLPENDLTNHEQTNDFIKDHNIDIIINAAAYVNVDEAETEKEKCMAINSGAVENLVNICEENDILLCHISTDYVFNGEKEGLYNETDKTYAINVYGKSKELAEKLIINKLTKFFIVRTAWLFSNSGNNFALWVVKNIDENKTLNIISDNYGTPTYVKDLSKIISKLIFTDAYGLYNTTNKGKCSWYEFAKKIVDIYDKSKSQFIIKTKSSNLIRKASRPINSALSVEKIEKILNIKVPDWETAVENFVRDLPK